MLYKKRRICAICENLEYLDEGMHLPHVFNFPKYLCIHPITDFRKAKVYPHQAKANAKQK